MLSHWVVSWVIRALLPLGTLGGQVSGVWGTSAALAEQRGPQQTKDRNDLLYFANYFHPR